MTLALIAPGTVEVQKKNGAPPAPALPPVLEYIAWCESRNRHFDGNGQVLRGKKNNYDIGKYQINALYWGEEAKKLGFDLFTEEGNEDMALAIYQKHGTSPWKWSQACWSRQLYTRAE